MAPRRVLNYLLATHCAPKGSFCGILSFFKRYSADKFRFCYRPESRANDIPFVVYFDTWLRCNSRAEPKNFHDLYIVLPQK
jgi:hypothetical protein